MKENNYTEPCKSITKIIVNKDLEFPNQIFLEFEVDGNNYEIKENLVMKRQKMVKISIIPLGNKTKSLTEFDTGIKPMPGNGFNVKYDPNKPKEVFLLDNDSLITWW